MKRSWSWREWLPRGAPLTLRSVTTTPTGVVVEADGPTFGRCPGCGRRSAARHSGYSRTLKDLPAHGQAVTLRVHVTRWRCGQRHCPTTRFADPLITIAAPRVHHTDRFGAVMHLVGHAVGGCGGERLLTRLGMAISDDTILRQLKRPILASPAPDVLHVVGIDDWTWQKGQQHYGTILVDLERRRVVDVLAVRTADAVATWLAAHPDITTISRDRHGPYAEAVRRGAPQAIQVADRFHLVLNLRGAVEQELSRQRHFLVVASDVVAMATVPNDSPVIVKPRRGPLVVVDRQRDAAQERRTGRLERFGLVKQLQAAGYSAPAIMRETGFGRAAVRKWLRQRELPPRNRMTPQPGMPAFFREYLQRRWTEGCQSAKALMAEIQQLGFVGCYTGLAKLIAPWREPAPRCETPIDDTVRRTVPLPCVPVRHISPQIAAALLSQPRPLLSTRQGETVDALKAGCPGFTTMRGLVLSFRTILRVGKVATLHDWLARAQATNIHALQRFVRTLRQDLSAVEGAVTERWSNGPVEGHINRLKTLKRQMYGRAGVDLLRARLLPLPPLVLR